MESESKSDSGLQFVAGDEWAGLDLIPDPVVVLDRDLCVVEANTAAESLFGATRNPGTDVHRWNSFTLTTSTWC
ncbi:MAG: PAS domain-containing protein [Acidimicrobiia bacterium]